MAVWAFLAAIAYVPSFLTQPGMIAADTKQYLYLDPGRTIASAISTWNPDIGAGGVTHENIGYLFPMGPYYWLVQQLGVPMWVGQRFWMGTLFFAAGTGVWMLCRLLGISRTGQVAAALAYMLSPFVVDDIARTSAVVMPWAALGWLLYVTVLAVRKGGWRYPALFAVIVALVGGVNATSILLVGLAPLLWLLNAVLITKEASWRQVWKATLRIGVLSLGVSLWWMSGLWAEGAYGINVLKYTETLPTVSITNLSSEILRGLGYWYFYGQDKLQPWTLAARGYTQWPWLIGVSFAVPTLCFLFAVLTRWRYRAFAIGLIVFSVVIAVGAYPYTNPTPLGNVIKMAGSDSTIGLAMRSSNRIVPVVVLGLALLLGAGISALRRSALAGVGDPRPVGNAGRGQSPFPVGRHPRRVQPGPPIGPAGLHHRCGQVPQREEPRHPGARGPRRGLRLLPLGCGGGPRLARADDTALPHTRGATRRRGQQCQPPRGAR